MAFKRLKELRIEKGISQDDLAKYLNIARSNIGKYENGDLDLNTEILIKYSEYFNASVDYILELTNLKEKSINYPETATISNSPKELEKAKKVIEFLKSLESEGMWLELIYLVFFLDIIFLSLNSLGNSI